MSGEPYSKQKQHAYMVQHGGEDYSERAYGIRYTR